MNREQLIDHLSYMQDFKVVSDDFRELIHNKKKRQVNYNAGSDPRIRSLLDYDSPNEKGRDIFLEFVSFSIAANLSFHSLRQPSLGQLSEMLQIAGYSPKQMEEYVLKENGIEPRAVPSSRLQPIVFLLTRVLYDTMSDKSEWQRRKRSEDNPALKRLQKLAKFMEDNELIYFNDWLYRTDRGKPDNYEMFVNRHSDFIVKQQCINAEMKETFKLVNARLEKIERDRDRAAARFMKNPSKQNKPTVKAPLSNPLLKSDFMSLMQSAKRNDPFLPMNIDKLLENKMSMIPTEVKVIVDKAEKESNTITEACDRILERADELKGEIYADDYEWMRIEYMPVVAEDAFKAIVSGDDEIFKLKIGRYVWQDFMMLSGLPMPVINLGDLEDEDDWDPYCTDLNGRLGLKIYDEGDLMEIDSPEGKEGFTLPVSSVLSKYADKPVLPHLYIRKSHIKRFKESGFSDRRARDFAVILGTLELVDSMETVNYELPYEDLFDLGLSGIVNESDIKTEAVKEVAASGETAKNKKAEDLERSLKQARKENQTSRHEINTLQRENDALQREIERLKQQLSEKEDIVKKVGSDVKNEISYPYRTKLKIVVYGGFEVFHRELLKLLPDVRIIEMSAHVDMKPFKNADIVFLQINKTDHSSYSNVCDTCKGAGVTYLHLNYASAKKCADVMVEEIRKIEK